jgi:hypothetical protein
MRISQEAFCKKLSNHHEYPSGGKLICRIKVRYPDVWDGYRVAD